MRFFVPQICPQTDSPVGISFATGVRNRWVSCRCSLISHNDARVWSEGSTATSNRPGDTATFRFSGTSVSWIGCEKGSAGGVADVFIDGVLQTRGRLNQSYPIEGDQMTG